MEIDYMVNFTCRAAHCDNQIRSRYDAGLWLLRWSKYRTCRRFNAASGRVRKRKVKPESSPFWSVWLICRIRLVGFRGAVPGQSYHFGFGAVAVCNQSYVLTMRNSRPLTIPIAPPSCRMPEKSSRIQQLWNQGVQVRRSSGYGVYLHVIIFIFQRQKERGVRS